MTNAGVLEKSADVMAALESLRARLSESDRSTVDEIQTFIAEVQKLVSTMDGQLAAMRFLAQKQYRPKSDAVPSGQLALDLLGFMLAQKDSGGRGPLSRRTFGASAAEGTAEREARE